MKKLLIVLVALFAMVAFVSGVVAQEKKTETPAAAPKAEKPKAPKAMKFSGAVAAYEAGKMIKIKGKDKEMTFDATADTKVKGEVKEGAKATVTYKKEGDKMVATAISGPAPKKPKTEKPPEKK
jgi:hypothetical protein